MGEELMKMHATLSALCFLSLLVAAYSLPASEDHVVPEDDTPDTPDIEAWETWSSNDSADSSSSEPNDSDLRRRRRRRRTTTCGSTGCAWYPEMSKTPDDQYTGSPSAEAFETGTYTMIQIGANMLPNVGGNIGGPAYWNEGYLDAYTTGNNYQVVTRSKQGDATQEWIFTRVEGSSTADGESVVTIQQKETGRYLDAYENSGNDYKVVTRTAQNNDSQRWHLSWPKSCSNNCGFDVPVWVYTIKQVSQMSGPNDRRLDAYGESDSGKNNRAVTRTIDEKMEEFSQKWIIKAV